MNEIVQIGAAAICVDHRGSDGRLPIVFLHAGVADRRMWAWQLDALQADHEVVAYDRRGFGKTLSPDEPYSQVEDLRQLLNHYQFEQVLLVGASQGGRIALDFALSHPDRVAGLILLAPAVSGESAEGFNHPPQVLALEQRLEQAEAAEDLEMLNALEAHAWLDGPLAAEGRVGGELRELFLDMNAIALRAPELTQVANPPAALGKCEGLATPVLLLWGALDFPHMQDLGQRLAAKLPNAKAMVIDGVAHLPNMEKPAMINLLISEFVRELLGQR